MICTEKDDYINDYYENNPAWTVTLNNGLKVFQDDGRQGTTISAWERLYNYCNKTDNYIVNMTIGFRCNVHHLKSGADGYYFSKGVRGALCLTKSIPLFFVGTYNNDKLLVTCWKVPEMLEETTEERDPTKAGICLIKRNISLI